MLEFYSLPEWNRLLCSVSIIACVMAQSIAIVVGFRRFERVNSRMWAEDIFQTALLVQIFVLGYLLSVVQLGTVEGYIAVETITTIRYAVFIVVLVTGLVQFVEKNSTSYMLAIISTASTLPVVESLGGVFFPTIYLASLIIFLFVALETILTCRKGNKQYPSSNSIKEAVDELRTGIMLYSDMGYVHMLNSNMQSIVLSLTGGLVRNGHDFYEEYLVKGKCKAGCEKISMGDKIAYKLPDENVWLFTKTEVEDKRETYTQILAVNITDEWEMTKLLTKQYKDLEERNEELKVVIQNMYESYREEGISNLRREFHDVLGQKIAILLGTLREGIEPTETILKSFAEDIPKMITEEAEIEDSPIQMLYSIESTLVGIGVKLNFTGSLPKNREVAKLFTEVIREASTNSVRHGFATEIYVKIVEEFTGIYMDISDNGMAGKKIISEGGGLSGMREKVSLLNGNLKVVTGQNFQINIFIPKEDI